MFKDRALQVKMVKTSGQEALTDDIVTHVMPDLEQIDKIAKEQVLHVAVAVGAILAGKIVLTTLSEIALITARAKIK